MRVEPMSDQDKDKPAPKKPRNVARIAVRAFAIRVVAGLVVGAALSEVIFRVRDDGAFPHLNLYAPDAALGVRLMPGETMRLSFGGNPVTTVRINKDGLRGADLPAPGDDEVVVVGDSQVFGLGVEENETFSARLEGLLAGSHVTNAGVPTYGPLEYERMVAELIEKRKPKRVVYVVNLVNDLFEAERPNTERHAVWDGWAVRIETAPKSVASFPARDLLFRKSHAVFALRKWWYRATGPTEAFSVPSTGTFRDIGLAAARAAEEHVRARDDTYRLSLLQDAKLSVANAELEEARDRFVSLVNEQQITTENVELGWATRWNPLKAAFAQPGDIVGTDDQGEYTEPLFATASIILKGAEVRKKIEDELRSRAKQKPADDAKITPVLDAIHDAQTRTDAVRAEVVPRIRAWSPLAPSIRRVKEMCDKAGARLFVVTLPIDVQVSKDEWAKYNTQPIDLEPARVLIDDIIDSAEDAGATAVDLTDALRAAEPGAFLNRDIHLSPKGHEAVAKALATALAAPPKKILPEPGAGRPPGRTLPTPLSAARERKEVNVPGSTAAGCETYIVDEWLTLRCHDHGVDKAAPIGVRVVDAPLGESVVYRDNSKPGSPAIVVQVPVLRDQNTLVQFRWPERGRNLTVSWSPYYAKSETRQGGVTISFYDMSPEEAKSVPEPPKPSDAVCAAMKEAGVKEACGDTPIFDNPACFDTYKGDAKNIVACLRGDRSPSCPRGSAPIGVFQHCAVLCSKDAPCAAGKCIPYAGAEVCQ